MISTSRITRNDLPGLKNLYEKGFGGSETNLQKMSEIFETIENNQDYQVIVAKSEDRVVGSVLGVICKELFGTCQPFMVIEDVVVLPDYRRQGIARQLMIRIEELARENLCSMILFVSSEHRTGAHKLYESLGYGADKVNGYRKRL